MSATKNSAMKSTSRRLQEVSIVGQYKLLSTIGKGVFYKVKQAQNMVTGEYVSIKIVDKSYLTSDGVQDLYKEIHIMKMLNHPNIVKLLQVIESERTLYIIMEYISGRNLYNYLDRYGSMNEKVARKMFRQIISAVEYCHQKRIVHRDLKAKNVLLDSDMNIKLIDFGLSELLTPGEKLQTLCGSLPYVAPELFLPDGYGPEADVWSLGVLLYVLLTDYTPFNGRTVEELRDKILLCQYQIPYFVSDECKRLLMKMLVYNPATRPNLISVMKDEWVNHECENELTPYVEPE